MPDQKQRPLPPDLRPHEMGSEELRALLQELDQGGLADEGEHLIDMLLSGYAGVLNNDLQRARRSLHSSQALESKECFVHLTRGRLFFLLGDLAASRECLGLAYDLATTDSWLCECVEALFEFHRRIGDYRAIEKLSEEFYAAEVSSCSLHEGFALHALELGDRERGLKHLQVAHEQTTRGEERFRLGLRIAALQEDRHAMNSLGPTDDMQRAALAKALDSIGDFKTAGSMYEAMGDTLEQARLMLWRGELDAVESLLAAEPQDARTLCYRGAVALLKADYDQAEAHLRASAERDEEAYETWIWLGELAMRQEAYESAAKHLRRGSELIDNAPDHFSFQCLRIILGIRSKSYVPRSIALSFEDVAAGVRLLIPDAPVIEDDNAHDALDLLERCLAMMGGNRSHWPTYVDGPEGARSLQRLQLPRSLRTYAKTTAWTLLFQDKNSVLEDFNAVIDSAPDSPLPHTYRGEVHLWSGDYKSAAADFQLGIDKPAETAIWAYIGMAATQLLRDDAEGALKTLDEGVKVSGVIGPTLYAYRGEARWLRGELDDAREDLELAVQQRRERVGAWVVLGLVYGALNEKHELNRVLKELLNLAPALLAESAQSLDRAHWPPHEALSSEDTVAVLEQARSLLRGNRASAMVTFFDLNGSWRFIPSQSPWDENFVQGELQDIRVQIERSMGFRRSGYVLPAGAEKALSELFLPARPGEALNSGVFVGIRIEQDRVLAVVEEADGARAGLYFMHPDLAGEKALVLGSLALVSVRGEPGDACEEIVEFLRANQHKKLPWKETSPL